MPRADRGPNYAIHIANTVSGTTTGGFMTRFKLAAAALAVMTSAADAQIAVDRWIALCSNHASEADQNACRSYTRGVADSVILMRKTNPQQVNICVPEGISEKDLVDLTLPYVQGQTPTSPPLPAANLLVNALAGAFPCAKR